MRMLYSPYPPHSAVAVRPGLLRLLGIRRSKFATSHEVLFRSIQAPMPPPPDARVSGHWHYAVDRVPTPRPVAAEQTTPRTGGAS